MKHRAHTRPTQQPEYIFQVESLSHEGRGIAHYGSHPDHPPHKHGKKVFIRYALPGETVRARITREVKKLEEADSLELLSEAPKFASSRSVHILGSVAAVICSISQPMHRLN